MMFLRHAYYLSYHRISLKSCKNFLPTFWNNRQNAKGSTITTALDLTLGCLSCFYFLFQEVVVDDDDIDYKLKDLRCSCRSNLCSINHIIKTIQTTMATATTTTTLVPTVMTLIPIYKTHCSQQQQQHQDVSHQKRKVEIKRLFSTTTTMSPPPPSLSSSSTQQHNNNFTTTDYNKTILHNQIIIIQQVLTPKECYTLQNEADRLINNPEGGLYSRDRIFVLNDDDEEDNDDDYDDNDDDDSLRRISIEDMSPIAQEISQRLIRERILPILSKQRITTKNNNTTTSDCNNNTKQEQQGKEEKEDLLTNLGLQDFKSTNAIWEWASDEPTVNVYTQGGKFEPHRDGYALTVVVLLNNPNQFKGGGTAFYNTNNNNNNNLEKSVVLDDKEKDVVSFNNHHHKEESSSLLPPPIDSSPSSFSFDDDDDDCGDGSNLDTTANVVIIQPKECGTAICFDGDMLHAGSPVIDGKRYVYVASFGIVCGSGIEH